MTTVELALTRPIAGQQMEAPELHPQPLGGLIIRDPKLRGGRPILAGTGVTVRTIAGHYKLGLNAEEISDDMDLDLTLVYAALTYYHLYKDEIEADILADSEEVLMEQYKELLRERPH